MPCGHGQLSKISASQETLSLQLTQLTEGWAVVGADSPAPSRELLVPATSRGPYFKHTPQAELHRVVLWTL